MNKIFGGGDIGLAVLIAAGVAVVFLILIGIVAKIFKKKEGGRVFQSVDCFNCGWRGKVSRYAGRCPRCNQRLGGQKAQHKVQKV